MRLKRYFCYERKRNYFSARTVKPDSSQIPQNSTLSPCNASQSGHTTEHTRYWTNTYLTANHSLQNSTTHETDKKIRPDRPPAQPRRGTSNRGRLMDTTNRDVHGQTSDKRSGDEMTSPPRAPAMCRPD